MSKKETTGQMYPLIINSSCYVGGNKFRYTFPKGSVDLRNTTVALSNIEIFYSWFNISAEYNNSIFTIMFPSALGAVWYQVIIPDGYYTISTLNSWFQSWCVQNDLYLIDGSGNYVYYIEFLANPTYYAVQINLYEVPDALPVGWSKPAAFTFPAIPTRTMITIGSANNFYKLIGFTPDTYVSASQLSNITPQISPVQSIIMQCSLLDNKYSLPSSNLYSFSVGNTEFGAIISSSPGDLVFCETMDSSVSFFEVSFVDQDYNQLPFRDPNMIIQLILKVSN